ncbi:hypothetical protein CLV88_10487 [Shimia abyssi]|uniref:DUF6268 domain-containing protein n=2 Tax=Shimia abyssi TaxID=1662395 RepID=A0A2P8FED6_9RHOB|nr:hypothetical protein CLV88_10487 [Shimia abyssi]
MIRYGHVAAAIGAAMMVCAGGDVAAQQRGAGWSWVVDGLAVYQFEADLSGGGTFSANRQFLRAGALYRDLEGTSYGVLASYGQLDYDFAGPAPWGNVTDFRVSAPVRFTFGETGAVFVSPQVRWDYESGASASDSMTYGVFGGVSWKINPNLRIGPAMGVFSELGTNGVEIFPALLVDWDIADRWNLSTGAGLGASQGPGVSLTYEASDTVNVSLITRSEKVRFLLDNSGVAPGGVGEDSSVPVVMSVEFKPSRALTLSAFAGAEFDGRLQLENTAGSVVSSQSYDPAPIAGFSFRYIF